MKDVFLDPDWLARTKLATILLGHLDCQLYSHCPASELLHDLMPLMTTAVLVVVLTQLASCTEPSFSCYFADFGSSSS